MNTNTTPAPESSSSSSSSSPGRPGRPSGFTDAMIDMLRSIIRETGISDSAAASRASIHPSTVSRWKRDFADLAILLRSAREEFRAAQLDIILETARSGQASGWRAAAWLLERTFPEDYAPRAKERAQFQERFDAVCAGEGSGTPWDEDPTAGQVLQNVQNPAPQPPPIVAPVAASVASREAVPALRLPVNPVQNVQKGALTGPVLPPVVSMKSAHAGTTPAEAELANAGTRRRQA